MAVNVYVCVGSAIFFVCSQKHVVIYGSFPELPLFGKTHITTILGKRPQRITSLTPSGSVFPKDFW